MALTTLTGLNLARVDAAVDHLGGTHVAKGTVTFNCTASQLLAQLDEVVADKLPNHTRNCLVNIRGAIRRLAAGEFTAEGRPAQATAEALVAAAEVLWAACQADERVYAEASATVVELVAQSFGAVAGVDTRQVAVALVARAEANGTTLAGH